MKKGDVFGRQCNSTAIKKGSQEFKPVSQLGRNPSPGCTMNSPSQVSKHAELVIKMHQTFCH